MSNPYYTVSGTPAAQTRGVSSLVRTEYGSIQSGFDGVNVAILLKGAIAGQVWTGTHDFTGATSILVPTRTYGTSGQYAVNMDTLNAAVFAAANLPAQTGNSGKLLTTNGTVPSWALVGIARSARTSNSILVAADNGSLIDITSGTFTQTITAAATLGTGWHCWYRNSGTGVVIHDPNGAETIDALATRNCYGQECILLFTDGVNFFTEVVHPFYFKPAATATFIMPSGYLEVESDLVGGGGGGGSGRRASAGGNRNGGAPGGAPGRVVRRHRNITAGTSITLTIGAAGTGGAAQTVNDTTGIDGTAGGNTSFGTLSIAYGGAAGKGGATASTSRANTSGSGSLSAGTSLNDGNSSSAGGPNFTNGSTVSNSWSTGGAYPQSNSEWGGAGSDSAIGNSAITGSTGSSLYGVSAAGCGGNITDANTMPASASSAGLNGTYTVNGGAPGGTCGASPTAGTAGAAATTDDACGNSGGGGGSSITAAAAAGGAGGFPGGAGGGGGASLNGFNSGAGGAGAAGRGIIKGVL